MLADAILAPCLSQRKLNKLNYVSTSEDTESFLRLAVWNGLPSQNVIDSLIYSYIDGSFARTHLIVAKFGTCVSQIHMAFISSNPHLYRAKLHQT